MYAYDHRFYTGSLQFNPGGISIMGTLQQQNCSKKVGNIHIDKTTRGKKSDLRAIDRLVCTLADIQNMGI